jgi:hypothetical protein
MTEKYFNRQEAEELLPLIMQWLEQAREQKQAADVLGANIVKTVSRVMMLGGSIPPFAELNRKKAEHAQASQKLLETIDQIQQTGCVVKDLDVGLVDFPSRRGDEEVYLCWKLGEDHIGFWHGIEEGFAGRKPLDEPPQNETPGRPRVH